jgi:hypothetical protein
MGIFLSLFALNSKYDWLPWLPIVAIFMYRLGFGLGLAPIPWFICSEIFNDELRPAASSIVGISNWTFAFITIFLWPVIRDGMTLFGSMWFFTGIIVIAIVFGLMFIPVSRKKVQNETSEETDPDSPAKELLDGPESGQAGPAPAEAEVAPPRAESARAEAEPGRETAEPAPDKAEPAADRAEPVPNTQQGPSDGNVPAEAAPGDEEGEDQLGSDQGKE